VNTQVVQQPVEHVCIDHNEDVPPNVWLKVQVHQSVSSELALWPFFLIKHEADAYVDKGGEQWNCKLLDLVFGADIKHPEES